MSVIGTSVKDTTPVTAAQPVYNVDMTTGLPASASGSAVGPGTAASATRVTYASDGSSVPVQTGALPAGTDKSGTATTTSGGLTVAPNSARRGLVGQNISAVSIGFNEFGGTAAIGTAGTYTVAAGGGFSISTNRAINFIAASATAAVTMTEF